MPVTTGGISGSRVFRSALGTSSFKRARRRVSLCMSWIVDVKDHPEIVARGKLLMRQIALELERGFPLDIDVLAARTTLEHYVRNWLTECRSAGLVPDEAYPGFTEKWKPFVEGNQAAEKAHQSKSAADAFKSGFAAGQTTATRALEPSSPPIALKAAGQTLDAGILRQRFGRRGERADADSDFEQPGEAPETTGAASEASDETAPSDALVSTPAIPAAGGAQPSRGAD